MGRSGRARGGRRRAHAASRLSGLDRTSADEAGLRPRSSPFFEGFPAYRETVLAPAPDGGDAPAPLAQVAPDLGRRCNGRLDGDDDVGGCRAERVLLPLLEDVDHPPVAGDAVAHRDRAAQGFSPSAGPWPDAPGARRPRRCSWSVPSVSPLP